jgi:hypothetical protein
MVCVDIQKLLLNAPWGLGRFLGSGRLRNERTRRPSSDVADRAKHSSSIVSVIFIGLVPENADGDCERARALAGSSCNSWAETS